MDDARRAAQAARLVYWSSVMALDWVSMFKRYVFDEARTPQFIAVAKLTRTQAHYEVLYYALLAVPVAVLGGLAALSGRLPHGDVPLVAFYALAVGWATALFAWNKNQIAGTFAATFPIAMLLYFAVFGFPGALGGYDCYLVLGIVVLWALYAWRLVRLAAAYPGMIDPPDGPKAKPRRRHPDYMTFDKDEK